MSTAHLHPPKAPYQWPTMNMTRRAQAVLFQALNDMGYTDRQDRHQFASEALGGDLSTYRELTDDDAWAIVAALRDEGWRQ
jgi:hypothetical protein